MVEGKHVIVTGGARGIGFGVCKCFAEAGGRIVVVDVNADGAKDAAAKLIDAGAQNAIGIGCDITRRDQVEKMAKDSLSFLGHVDVLVNNAGICPFIDIMEMTPQDFQRSIDVNLVGAFHCTQVVAKSMLERNQGGRIIFITSLSTLATGPTQVDYAASKSGLRMLMAGFATRLGPYGINCNAIAPGILHTDMTERFFKDPKVHELASQKIPNRRLCTPEDIGKAALFLASDLADHVNGISLRVDGGKMAQA